MNAQVAFETVTDWIVGIGLAVLLAAVYGSWLASYRTPAGTPVGDSLWYRLPVWGQIAVGLGISAIGLAGCVMLWYPLPISPSAGGAVALRIAGMILAGAGEALWFWARRTLGAMMGVSTASAAALRAQPRLITHGPYAYVRHPMYVSYWLLLAGLTLIYRTWTPALLLVLMVASLTRRARREDQALAAALGSDWQAYAARIPAFLPRWLGDK